MPQQLWPPEKNHTWISPRQLRWSKPDRPVSTIADTIERLYQSRWYILRGLSPGDDVTVTLTECAVDFTLLGFTDIRVSARHLLAQRGGGVLDADDMDSDDMDSDDMDSDDMDSDDMDSDDMDSDDMDSDDMDSNDWDGDGQPDFPPFRDVYGSAQRHALRSASVTPGPADEQIHMTARAGGGDLYFRVRGHHGAYAPGRPYQISAIVSRKDPCGVVPPPSWTKIPAALRQGKLSTLILTNTDRRSLGLKNKAERDQFVAKLEDIAQNVGGVVYDLKDDHNLARLYGAWDNAQECVPLANTIVESIRAMVAEFVGEGALPYLVLAGGDDVIPFARIEDRASISREWQWTGPYDPRTPLGAALTYGFYLSDDGYGRSGPLDPRGKNVRAPTRAVGRLVETGNDITAYADWFLRKGSGGIRVKNALVTGYTFVSDLATNFSDALERAGATGVTVDRSLIRDDWTSADLGALLVSATGQGGPGGGLKKYDIIAAQGHYSANTLVPADLSAGKLYPTDTPITNGDLAGSLWITIGCHSGHDIIDVETRPGYKHKDSWSEALLRRGTTLIGGTGYQYAESLLPENSERLYTYLAQEIAGATQVALGDALIVAKRRYLAHCIEVRGMDEKLIGVSTLYGLPMLQVGVGNPIAPPADLPPVVAPLVATATTAIRTKDVTLAKYALMLEHAPRGGGDYVSADHNTIVRPLRPVLPGVFHDISEPGFSPLGVIWTGGHYTEAAEAPLIARPVTEADPRTPKYRNRAFLPARPFHVARAAAGHQSLVFAPMQFNIRSGQGRRWKDATFTIYYSNSHDATALHDSPAIRRPRVVAVAAGVRVRIDVRHYGSAAETVAAWASYLDGGALHTVPLDHGPSIHDGNGWLRGFTAILPAAAASGVFFQAVGGNGRVSALTSAGRLFTPTPASVPTETALTLKVVKNAAYRDKIDVEAELTTVPGGKPVKGDVLFRFGGSRIWKTTVAGTAKATLTVATRPRDTSYLVVASFPGASGAAPAAASKELAVSKAPTRLVTASGGAMVTVRMGSREEVMMLVRVAHGHPLGDRPLADRQVTLVRDGTEYHTYTDPDGVLRIEPADVDAEPGGTLYDVAVRFEGDERYEPSDRNFKLRVP